MSDGKLIRWNGRRARFEAVAVEDLDEKKHDIGNSRPTTPALDIADVLEAIEKAKK